MQGELAMSCWAHNPKVGGSNPPPATMNATAEMQWRSPVYRSVSSLSVASDFPEARLWIVSPCKLTRAFGPRNSMKIAQSQAIIQNGWEWRDRKDNGDAEAECKFDPERA